MNIRILKVYNANDYYGSSSYILSQCVTPWQSNARKLYESLKQ